jgi:hypothetical protein
MKRFAQYTVCFFFGLGMLVGCRQSNDTGASQKTHRVQTEKHECKKVRQVVLEPESRFQFFSISKWSETILGSRCLENDMFADALVNMNSAANELFSLPELPDGVVSDLARMFASTDEDEVWRDYCLQFLGSALEREDGVTDEDRALARETLVEALASTNATFAGTALRALHRGDPADPLVASNALRIARDPSYPSSSRTAALLILEDCVRATPSTASTLTETASAISSDPSASSLLRRTAEAVQKRSSVQSHDQWNDQGGSR